MWLHHLHLPFFHLPLLISHPPIWHRPSPYLPCRTFRVVVEDVLCYRQQEAAHCPTALVLPPSQFSSLCHLPRTVLKMNRAICFLAPAHWYLCQPTPETAERFHCGVQPSPYRTALRVYHYPTAYSVSEWVRALRPSGPCQRVRT